jgi:hypothetical protein
MTTTTSDPRGRPVRAVRDAESGRDARTGERQGRDRQRQRVCWCRSVRTSTSKGGAGMMLGTWRWRGAVLGIVLGGWCVGAAVAAEPDVNVRWRDGHDGMTFDFRGTSRAYPDDVAAEEFPAPGAPLALDVQAEWPIVTLRARWSMATEGWPEAHRDQALDLILMYASDAELYAHVYPKAIKESKFTAPPAYLREAAKPHETKLAAGLRGQRIAYEITGKGGFGAADYKIRTEILLGVSADEKTVFYHDNPKSISEHLEKRDYIFMAHDAGDRLLFEIHAVCICKPRAMFRGEALRRVQADAEYLVKEMHTRLKAPPTEQGIAEYLAHVRKEERRFNGEAEPS